MTVPNPNPFVWQASGVEPLPNGSYLCEFKGMAVFANEKVVDPRWRWVWRVTSGSQSGREATALTDCRLTAQTHAGRLVTGMAGRQMAPGEDVSALIESLKNKRYMVTVAIGPKGGKASVQTVSAPPEM